MTPSAILATRNDVLSSFQAEATTNRETAKPKDFEDTFYYPPDIANDLQGVDLTPEFKVECFACAWEYTRCIIPQYTNWNRYVAFIRVIIIATIAEARGDLVDLMSEDNYVLGYNLQDLFDILFKGTPGYELMDRECRANMLISSEKASSRKHNSELFRRYVNSLASSPRNWFRLRDTDALMRFSVAAALACSDLDDIWFSDEQWEILNELGTLLYDSVAFYKHRSEGETNSTFAYMPEDLRIYGFRISRELLWALDVSWKDKPYHYVVGNFIRFFGGTLHILMRRYRFVEEGLTMGKVEDASVIDNGRQKIKLWNRVDAMEPTTKKVKDASSIARYKAVLARSDRLCFPEMAGLLESVGDGSCNECFYRESYGAQTMFQFGGAKLCNSCKVVWREYLMSLPARTKKAFPSVPFN